MYSMFFLKKMPYALFTKQTQCFILKWSLKTMESGSWRDYCQSGVNPTTPIYGDKPGSKLDDDDIKNSSTPKDIERFIKAKNFFL